MNTSKKEKDALEENFADETVTEESDDEKTCHICSYFFNDTATEDYDFGVCMMDDAFEPYVDDIIEESDFSCCRELYQEKRFEATRPACPHFEEVEMLEFDGPEKLQYYLLSEQYAHADLSGLIEMLSGEQGEKVELAVNNLTFMARQGNQTARQALFEFYMNLKPAENLDEVHARVSFIDEMTILARDEDMAAAFIAELKRTKSNNTTQQLFRRIIEELKRFPSELIDEPIRELLRTKQFSHRMRRNIEELLRDEDEWDRDDSFYMLFRGD